MAVDGILCGRRRRKREESREYAPDSAWVWRMSTLTRDGDGRTRLARLNFQARMGTVYLFIFSLFS